MDDMIYFAKAAAYLAAGLVMGIGALGPALGQGFIGAKACENLIKAPNDEVASKLRTTMLMAMGLVETSAIYAFIIAIWLIIVGTNL
jgi:F-type H+-transporting ATPase subunit c